MTQAYASANFSIINTLMKAWDQLDQCIYGIHVHLPMSEEQYHGSYSLHRDGFEALSEVSMCCLPSLNTNRVNTSHTQGNCIRFSVQREDFFQFSPLRSST